MLRSSRPLTLVVALAGLAALTAPLQAKVNPHRHRPVVRREAGFARPSDFPVYVDTGTDRDFGSSDRYFSDTKRPSYIVGPAYFQRWQ